MSQTNRLSGYETLTTGGLLVKDGPTILAHVNSRKCIRWLQSEQTCLGHLSFFFGGVGNFVIILLGFCLLGS
jgi:hypothetical protein